MICFRKIADSFQSILSRVKHVAAFLLQTTVTITTCNKNARRINTEWDSKLSGLKLKVRLNINGLHCVLFDRILLNIIKISIIWSSNDENELIVDNACWCIAFVLLQWSYFEPSIFINGILFAHLNVFVLAITSKNIYFFLSVIECDTKCGPQLIHVPFGCQTLVIGIVKPSLL